MKRTHYDHYEDVLAIHSLALSRGLIAGIGCDAKGWFCWWVKTP